VKNFILPVKLFSTLLILILSFTQSCQQDNNNIDRKENGVFDKIDNYLNWEDQNGFSGIISIKIKDNPIYSRSFGYADADEGISINSKTVFDIGSLTKQFTSAAILKLEMEGKLSVNDSLSRFFPKIREDKANITIHQLLTHTSGLRWSVGYDYKRTTREEFLTDLFNSDLLSSPGSHYGYSHAGYSLLGAIIEILSGVSYEDYLRKSFLLPAGMNNTGYVAPLWEEDQIAHGYSKCRDWGKPMDMPWASDGPYWNLKANGGLISSSEDLMLWIEELDKGDILSPEAKEKYLSPHVKEGAADTYYSYGWVIARSSRNTEVILHNGDNRRFYTDILRYPEEDVTIILLSNLAKPGNEDIASELARIIFWPEYQPKVRGVVQECLDSLPNSRIGKVAGKFLQNIENKDPVQDTTLINELFSDYLKRKHTTEHILEVLNTMKDSFSNLEITGVIVTGYTSMELSLFCNENNSRKRLFMRLVFDEEDDYLIRMLMYDTRKPR